MAPPIATKQKMDDLLQQLLSFPPHPPPPQPIADEDFEAQCDALIRTLSRTANATLTSGVTNGGDLLDLLDPSINTLPYLWTLLAHAKLKPELHDHIHPRAVSPLASGPFWNKCTAFLERFDARQAKHAGAKWREVVELVAVMASSSGQPILAVKPIRSAVLRMDPASTVFTSNHHTFISLCLDAKAYRAALPILDRDLHEFPPSASAAHAPYLVPSWLNKSGSTYITVQSGISAKLTYQTHLEYHLYGAMCYMALKRWERALELLTHVITAPVNERTSSIMVEAYKKYLLVGLIHTGSMLSLPFQTSHYAARVLRALCKAYEGVAELFQRQKYQKLLAEIEAGQAVWNMDCNNGLMNQVKTAYRRFCLLALERTYTSLPLSQAMAYDPLGALLATPTTPHTTIIESLLFEMIASGDLIATLSFPTSSPSLSSQSADPFLRFGKSSTASTSTPLDDQHKQLSALHTQIERIVHFNQRIKAQDAKISMTKEYTTYALKARAKEAGSGANSGGGIRGGKGGDGTRQYASKSGMSRSGGGSTGGASSEQIEFMDLDDDEDLMEPWL